MPDVYRLARNKKPARPNPDVQYLPSYRNVQTICRMLEIISERSRYRILVVLSKQEMHVDRIAFVLGIAYQSTAFHLRQLRMAGIVHSRKVQKMRVYNLNPEIYDSATRMLTIGNARLYLGE